MPGFPRVAHNWEVFETQSPDGVLPGPAVSCQVLPGPARLGPVVALSSRGG